MTSDPIYRPSDMELIKATLRSMRGRSVETVVFGGVVDRAALSITEVYGGRTNQLGGQQVHRGVGLGGRAMRNEQPARVSDYFSSREITHEFDAVVRHEGLLSMLAVPVVVDGQPRAVLYAATRDELPFSDVVAHQFMLRARAVAHELKIRDEVDRRLAILRSVQTGPGEDVRDLQETIRLAHAELVALAHAHPGSEMADSVRAVADALLVRPAVPADLQPLSPRELDVLSQVALGCSYAEVGDRLSLKPGTVKTYMRSVLSKLHCHSRAEAVAAARRLRLLP